MKRVAAKRNMFFYECCSEPYLDVTYDFVLRRILTVKEDGEIMHNPLGYGSTNITFRNL